MNEFDLSPDYEGFDDEPITDRDLVGYFSPKNIVDDPEINVSRKRALLAHWASDVHAIPSIPPMRRGAGVTTSIDAILAALKDLDHMVDGPAVRATADAGSMVA